MLPFSEPALDNVGNIRRLSNGNFRRDDPGNALDNSYTMTTLISRIEERLSDLGLAATAASKRAGLDRTWISDLKSGRKRDVKSMSVYRLAEVLQCNPLWLWKGVGDKEGDPAVMDDVMELYEAMQDWTPEERKGAVRVIRAGNLRPRKTG